MCTYAFTLLFALHSQSSFWCCVIDTNLFTTIYGIFGTDVLCSFGQFVLALAKLLGAKWLMVKPEGP